LRAWLYRIAHNRCIDELRRPVPVATELDADGAPTLAAANAQEPAAVAERSEALARLVADVQTLPPPQRSVLLMRELQGLSYRELSDTLGISVPAVKSLLLRARTGLVDLKVARDAPCEHIRLELASAADRGVRMSGHSRRHIRECGACRTYHRELRGLHKQFAALTPSGPLAQLGLLFGFGGTSGAGAGAGGGVAAGGGIAAGGGASIIGGVTAATAVKLAAVIAVVAAIGTAGQAALAPPVTTPAHTITGERLPADARQLTQLTGAAVAPSPAAVNAGLGGSGTAAGGAPGSSGAALGATGASGASGAIGASGTTGVTGTTGTSGASGASGVTGTSAAGGGGAIGEGSTSGASGFASTTTATLGASGPTATDASAASAGSSGDSGTSGNSGTTGDTGTSGSVISGTSATFKSSGSTGATLKSSGSTGATGSDTHHKSHRRVLTGLIPAASTSPTGAS
jgi:DNA-binding CsgD family transcriptional regulator